jgi:hypothetical protein
MKGDRERGKAAEKRLAGVALLALAKLEASRTAPRGASSKGAIALIAFFLLGSAGLLAYLLASR